VPLVRASTRSGFDRSFRWTRGVPPTATGLLHCFTGNPVCVSIERILSRNTHLYTSRVVSVRFAGADSSQLSPETRCVSPVGRSRIDETEHPPTVGDKSAVVGQVFDFHRKPGVPTVALLQDRNRPKRLQTVGEHSRALPHGFHRKSGVPVVPDPSTIGLRRYRTSALSDLGAIGSRRYRISALVFRSPVLLSSSDQASSSANAANSASNCTCSFAPSVIR
jgi:hypothetical protein